MSKTYLKSDHFSGGGSGGRHDIDAGVSRHDDTKKTVHGIGDPFLGEQPINITGITETAVYFGTSNKLFQTSERSVIGTIDRVTGDVSADFASTDTKTGKVIASMSYALKCKPAQRMF